jgi:hypothetical protein
MAKPFNGKAKRKKLTIVGPHLGGKSHGSKKVHKHGLNPKKSSTTGKKR